MAGSQLDSTSSPRLAAHHGQDDRCIDGDVHLIDCTSVQLEWRRAPSPPRNGISTAPLDKRDMRDNRRMCLIALAYKVHPAFPLLLVANRDEFHARAAAPLAWWMDSPQILAGRDLQEGGTWLGASRGGRLAAVTNVRAPQAMQRNARSRGQLITAFLDSSADAAAFAASLEPSAASYGGFNLLLFDGTQLHYASNHPQFVSRAVEPGIHALSNAQLDTPWPKAVAVREAMQEWVARDLADEATMLASMQNSAQAPDLELPATGVNLEMERLLSAAFIRTPSYGTRCTSLVKISRDGAVDFLERRYAATGQVSGENREKIEADFD